MSLLAATLLASLAVSSLLAETPVSEATVPDGAPLCTDRGPENMPLCIPRGETLTFKVKLHVPVLGNVVVGKLTLRAEVELFREGVLVRDTSGARGDREVGVLTAVAEGGYGLYTLHQNISARYLPQVWPSLLIRSVQTGSENHRRETLVGERDGVQMTAYRSDKHCKGCPNRAHFVEPTFGWQAPYHCSGCKRGEHRVWKDARWMEVRPRALDIVGALYLPRALLQSAEPKATFLMIDRHDLWQITLKRGARKQVKTPAGAFWAVEMMLETTAPPGVEKPGDEFRGIFGIHGSIGIWLHEKTGVPVLVEGLVPAGFVDLDVRIELEEYVGTPAGFGPLE